MLLALLGGAAGVALGGLATAIFATAKHWAIVIPAIAWTGGLAAALVIGAAAGLLPALRAAPAVPYRGPVDYLMSRYYSRTVTAPAAEVEQRLLMPACPGVPHDDGMGLLTKITGGADKKLLATGLLGRGIITDVRPTGTTLEVGNGLVQRVCVFTVEVSLDHKAPYTATCKQRIPEIQLPQIQLGNTTVAVRADPENLAQIALDFATEPPMVTAPGGAGNHSAAEILATGAPGRAVIVHYQPLGKRNPAGVDLYAFLLTVMPDSGDPYQIQVGNPTPPAALPFLFPGSRVPVKIGTIPNAVVIDWAAAAVGLDFNQS